MDDNHDFVAAVVFRVGARSRRQAQAALEAALAGLASNLDYGLDAIPEGSRIEWYPYSLRRWDS